MRLLERAANEQFFNLSIGKRFERLLQPYHGQSASTDSEGGTKSEEPRQASVPDLLVTKAKQTGATVTFIEDGSLLEPIGGVGAFLRWRE